MAIAWSDEWNTGISEIDRQHRRIVGFINSLEKAQLTQDRTLVTEVVAECAEYTSTHFSYEEQLQKAAGYEFLDIHKKVHELFTQRINEYLRRLQAGDDIAVELQEMLSRWLVNHIKLDDADYVGAVKVHKATLLKQSKKKSGKGFFRKLLG